MAEAITIIDLRKPGDMNLVHRAVVVGWPVSQSIQDQVSSQFEAALEHYSSAGTASGQKRLIKLCKMAIAMQARDLLAARPGMTKSDFASYLRARAYPEPTRKPRVSRQQLRVRAALTHKAAREANNSAQGQIAERTRDAIPPHYL